MTEYFVQPGTRVPLGGESTSPPDTSVPRGNPELGDGGVVQVIDAEWKRRAGVARNLAAELAGVTASIRSLNKNNHYGIGAKEGEDFYRGVDEFLKQWSQSLTELTSRISNLATQCDNAHIELCDTDDENGRTLET
ncbi:hypothetical protein LH935_06235 [Gordonia polyisoprenivorans]|uniref:hypothetical protein n=1 Tax=Gordonia polyisoprenivorans TaxID=84595 RepID=UPI0022346845|nr:hypothetical protein LH935_06235 [Gordonia polyisoprenivorans]